MKKNIGILFPSSRKMGVFQYAMSIIEGLSDFCPDFNYTVLYFGEESPKEFLKTKNLENVSFASLDQSPNGFTGKIKILANLLFKKPIFVTNKENKSMLDKAMIDLLIIPFPILFGFENRAPYIVSIPDIMHKYYPKFPEYDFWSRTTRDAVYKTCSENSLLCVVDSTQGLKDLNKFYNIPERKIKPIPYIPPGYIFELKDMDKKEADNLLVKYKLPEKFIFYPAQFWFHKNHLRLVKALRILKEEKNAEVFLVLSGNPGANNKNYATILNLIKEAEMESQVICLGYVSDQEMVALYKKSIALVFCSLGGPTNIPLVEAMVLGTPVLCPNLFAMPEQVGDAGVLFDPFSERDMAEKIYKIWFDESLRKRLSENTKKMAKKITSQEFTKSWVSAIKEALYAKRH